MYFVLENTIVEVTLACLLSYEGDSKIIVVCWPRENCHQLRAIGVGRARLVETNDELHRSTCRLQLDQFVGCNRTAINN